MEHAASDMYVHPDSDLLWGCTQFTSSISVAYRTPLVLVVTTDLGTAATASCGHQHYCFLTLLFSGLLSILLCSCNCILLHCLATDTNWLPFRYLSFFKIPVPAKKSLSLRYLGLTIFYSPTPLWLQQRSGSLTVSVLTLPCLDFISGVL